MKKEFFKQLAISLCSFMISATLVMVPIPLTSTAYATGTETEEECVKDALNDDGSAGVYKPGCEFNDALTKLNETPNEYSIEGIIEQFVMYSFAVVALQSLFFKTTQRSQADCPMNNNAQITLRLMQVASVLYVLGEMKAKAKMKEAQQLVVDTAFAPQVKQDETMEGESMESLVEEAKRANQRQLEAYQSLLKVYDLKIEGIETKVKLATAAEAGYLGALAAELLLVQAEKRMCDTTYLTAQTTSKTNTGTIAGYLGAASATAATVYGASLCGAGVGGMTSLQTIYTTSDSTRSANGQSKSATAIADDVTEGISLAKFFGEIGSCITGVCIEGFDFGDLDTSIVTETATATADDITAKTAQTTETTAFTTATSTCASCPSCVGVSGTMASDQASKQTPIQCCGADTLTGTNGYSSIPYPSVMDKKIDIDIKKIPLIGKSEMDLIKPGILNFIEQYYFARNFNNIKNKKLDPEKEVAKLAKFYKQLDHLDKNFETEIWSGIDQKAMEIELANSKEFKSGDVAAVIKKIKSELLVSDAHAGDTWSQILGFGGKLMMMSKLFGKFLRNKALPKPKSRMFTFGAIAAVDLAMIIWQQSKIKSNKKEREFVHHEMQRFANSHALKIEYDLSNPDDGDSNNGPGVDPDPYINTTGQMACATPSSGGGFTPAACPAEIPKNSIQLPSSLNVSNSGVSPELAQLPALMTEAVTAAASGMEATNPKQYHGSLNSVNKNRNLIKKAVGKLVDDYDKAAGHVSEGPKTNSLKKALGIMRKTFKGTPINQDFKDSPMAGNTILAKDEAGKKSNSEAAKKSGDNKSAIAMYNPPAAKKPDFDFSLSDSQGGSDVVAEMDDAAKLKHMAEFDLEQSDVNSNAQVSIFKMISNRYLMSYPILLKRKKQAKLPE